MANKMVTKKMVKHVVLDSAAFIRNAPIKDIGEVAYTIPEVVKEIRDKATKERLQVLPYELKFKEPSQDSLNFVTDFAKKTGDYGSLSAVDIRVMALTHQLEKEINGKDHIKTAPDKKVQWQTSARPLEKATDIAGFYLKKKKPAGSRTASECSSVIEQPELRQDEVCEETSDEKPDKITDLVDSEVERSKHKKNSEIETVPTNSDTDSINPTNNKNDYSTNVTSIEGNNTNDIVTDNLNENILNDDSEKAVDLIKCDKEFHREDDLLDGDIITAEQVNEDDDESDNESDDDDDDDDDDDGWITPSNIKSIKQQMGGADKEEAEVAVGCLTTDFAIQNVLIQMGLNVISVDGYLIKRAKNFVLRCSACMKITTNIQKIFCPHCGNKTLAKLSMTINEDGSIRYFFSRRKQVTARGTRYSLPLPKGGKHADNPLLVEDQPIPQNRAPRKALATLDVFDPDYCAGSSPFTVNDVTSRASQLGIRKGHCFDKRNPNMNRKGGRNRRR